MSKIFKNGNSLALRIPKELGFNEGDQIVLKRIGGYDFLYKLNPTYQQFSSSLDQAMEGFDLVSPGHQHFDIPTKKSKRKTSKENIRKRSA